MEGMRCPHCGHMITVTTANGREIPIFAEKDLVTSHHYSNVDQQKLFTILYVRCPNPKCKKPTCQIFGSALEFTGFERTLVPRYRGISLPDYIPEHIRNDYIEACSILEDSPKASSTLSRRCLQGMIRDFWNVRIEEKPTLEKEIRAIKEKIPDRLFKALLDFKSLGNIGAHPEIDTSLIVDIEPGEATKLIKLIELLISDWYIRDHEDNQLLDEISKIKADKDSLRNGQQSDSANN
ncbi:DUF4145 domain-containing protein [Ruminococcaceae bacterium OttesenSCG-928-I18]|nr:DUF4145 domain-containing protein [Ruminococcaceae bacterium OttesenSCG-928-I18]